MIFLVTVHIIISMFLYSLTVFLLIFLMSIAKAYALLAPVFKRARNAIPLTFTIAIGWITCLFWLPLLVLSFHFSFSQIEIWCFELQLLHELSLLQEKAICSSHKQLQQSLLVATIYCLSDISLTLSQRKTL